MTTNNEINKNNNDNSFLCSFCNINIPIIEQLDHILSHQLENYSEINQNLKNSENNFYLDNENSLNNLIVNQTSKEEKNPISYKLTNINNLSSENKSCIICFQKFELNDLVTCLPCIHIFHKLCIENWIKIVEKCPICKYEWKNNLIHNNQNNNYSSSYNSNEENEGNNNEENENVEENENEEINENDEENENEEEN